MDSIYCRCGNLRRGENQRYCLDCHAASMRRTRPKWTDLTYDQKKKAKCRAYSRTLEIRGKIHKKPCEQCGFLFSEKHHSDYSDSYNIKWLCRGCHLNIHSEQNANVPLETIEVML